MHLIYRCLGFFIAVKAGFEPAVPLRVRQFSKLVVSATHPLHRSESELPGAAGSFQRRKINRSFRNVQLPGEKNYTFFASLARA